MLEAMGMYRLIRYSPTPTTINRTTIFSKGTFWYSSNQGAAIGCPFLGRRQGLSCKSLDLVCTGLLRHLCVR